MLTVQGEPHGDRPARGDDAQRPGRQQNWWQAYDLESSSHVGLEAEAPSTRYYASAVVPRLLQTVDYARAIYKAATPIIVPERMSELVKVRLMRQELLKREPTLVVSAIVP